MKKKLTIICFLVVVFSIYSQKHTYIGEIKYSETLKLESSKEITEYNLYFNTSFGLYEEIIKLNKGKDYGFDSEGNNIQSIYFNEDINTYTFLDLKTNKFFFKKHIVNNIYAVEDHYEKINWKIYGEYKKIGNYKCQKAIGMFRGREYTAWFTSKIPIQFGPWKLSNLKGAILEAYDRDMIFYAIATNIQLYRDPKDISTKINKIYSEKKITLTQYQKKWKNRHIEAIAYINSKLSKNEKPYRIENTDLTQVKELEIFAK